MIHGASVAFWERAVSSFQTSKLLFLKGNIDAKGERMERNITIMYFIQIQIDC